MSPKLESMFEPLTRSASVKSVYGEAISANGKTIIPVARIAYGFGGGRGRKHREGDPTKARGGRRWWSLCGSGGRGRGDGSRNPFHCAER